MSLSLEDFSQEFEQQIRHAADAAGIFVEDAFFDIVCDRLEDCGEFEATDRAHYEGPPRSGIRVDGYGGDPGEADGVLTLIALDFNHDSALGTLTRTRMDAAFRRLSKFLQRALDADWRNALEETGPAFGLADLMASRWRRVKKVRLFLLSNQQLSQRVDGRAAAAFDGREVVYSVWDLRRLHQLESSGREREEMEIDLDSDFKHCGGALPLLPAHLPDGSLDCYLAVVPARLLGEIFGRWGDRLLEQNVRVFLQARGKVNKGIRNTIDSEPAMFFAYNNGITATAEEVTIRNRGGRQLLTRIKNLQVVNGGQTTGSIYRAYREGADLSGVFVQMKLSKVAPKRSAEIVRNISKYANTQNRISAADFFSNHPFHIRMEDFSRRIYAPSKEGTFQQTKWFYERARGQYASERAKRSPAERRAFDSEHPRRQVISKTDFAKYMNVWNGRPHQVSLGAQKNFAFFAQEIGKTWTTGSTRYGEDYFREAVAKAVIFKATERLVSAQPWYQGGYRANIVAYAIARLAHAIAETGRALDFDRIWQLQKLPPPLEDALSLTSKVANDVLTMPPEGMSNVTEWAKKPACWSRVMAAEWSVPRDIQTLLLDGEEKQSRTRTARRNQRALDSIDRQNAVVTAGSAFWTEVREWGTEHRRLSPDDLRLLGIATGIPSRLPTESQTRALLRLLDRLRKAGGPFSLPTGAE